MKVDMDTGVKIATWMKDKVAKFQCPVCQHLVFNTSEYIYTLTADSGAFEPKSVVTLQCANCACLTFFDAASIGIVAAQSKPENDVHHEIMDTLASAGFDPLVAEIQQHLHNHKGWLTRLQENPDAHAKLDEEIHRVFANLADKMIAGLKAAVAAAPPDRP